jgi:ECF transporter S component (folate family)
MKKIKQLFSDSLHEFTVTKNLVLCGLMAALAIVLSIVASISIGPYVKIGFSGLPNRIVEFLFGPVVGCIFGGALDLLKFMIKPDGPFFFGFTFNVMLAGLIYGCLLYHKPLSIKRIVIAEFLVKLIVNCGLNTLWISMLYGKAFFVLLPMRLLKNVIMLPIDSAIVFFALSLTKQTVGRLGFSLISAKKLSAEES